MSGVVQTREGWLVAATEMILSERFRIDADERPAVRVSCGWPHSGGTRKRRRVIGQCWSNAVSADNVFEIFISPYLAAPIDVLVCLVHELVHAVVGLEAKHGPEFRATAKRVGLAAPWTGTVGGDDLVAWCDSAAACLGAYPGGTLDPSAETQEKKQTNRQLKVQCVNQDCPCVLDDPNKPYIVRMSRMQMERGMPRCGACDQAMVADNPDEDPEGEDE